MSVRSAETAARMTVQLSSTRRGARLARRFAAQHLAERGIPYDTELSYTASLVTAELASNALRHCGGTGRDFRLSVVVEPGPEGVIRIEVTDACADRPLPATRGNGLRVVEALASRWGSVINDPVTKTVWAELVRCR